MQRLQIFYFSDSDYKINKYDLFLNKRTGI